MASDWQLPISYTKCCVLDIGKRAGSPDILCMLGDKTVEQTEEVLDLGVTINNRLNFSKHRTLLFVVLCLVIRLSGESF